MFFRLFSLFYLSRYAVQCVCVCAVFSHLVVCCVEAHISIIPAHICGIFRPDRIVTNSQISVAHQIWNKMTKQPHNNGKEMWNKRKRKRRNKQQRHKIEKRHTRKKNNNRIYIDIMYKIHTDTHTHRKYICYDMTRFSCSIITVPLCRIINTLMCFVFLKETLVKKIEFFLLYSSNLL